MARKAVFVPAKSISSGTILSKCANNEQGKVPDIPSRKSKTDTFQNRRARFIAKSNLNRNDDNGGGGGGSGGSGGDDDDDDDNDGDHSSSNNKNKSNSSSSSNNDWAERSPT
jgi:hypothetical protein